MSAAPGWYADPSGAAGQLRWWDGQRWTEHVTPDPAASTAATADASAPSAATEHASAGGGWPAQAGTGHDAAAAGEGTSDVPDPQGTEGTDGAAAGDDASVGTSGLGAPEAQPGTGAPEAANGQDEPVATGWGAATPPQASDTAPAPGAVGVQPPPPVGGPLPPPAASPWGTPSPAPSWGPPPASSGSGVRTGLIVAAIVGVLVLVLVVLALVFFLRSDDGGSASGPAPAAPVDGELSVGDVTSGRIAPNGTATTSLTVDERQFVVIDVRSTDGELDAVVEVFDASGRSVGRNDDRSSDGASRVGGAILDPLLELELQAGTYTVEVTGFGSSSGSFELAVR